MKSVQLFVPTFRVDECLTEIRECLEKGWTGRGKKTDQFEEEWKKYTNLPNAHFLNSATAGLHLAVKILKKAEGWQDGDEIISTPLTFVSTNHAVCYENLHVTFADIDEYLCLDPDDVERKITEKTRAVVFVGIGGSTGKFQKIVDLCRKHNLKLILDAAHMAGTRSNGEIPGKDADVIVYSFQAVKNLPTADSGMICFANKDHDVLCRRLSWLGIDKDTYTRNKKDGYSWLYEVDQFGYKYNGNDIMAAIGLVQLRYLDQDNSYRRQIARWYDQELSGISGVETVKVPQDCESSRHLYMIRTARRDELLIYLNSFGIYPGVHYRDNIEYSLYNYAEGTCPNARKISKEVISLPMHLRLTYDDVKFIAERIREFCK